MKKHTALLIFASAVMASCSNGNELEIPDQAITSIGKSKTGSYTILQVKDKEGKLTGEFTLVVKAGEFTNEHGFNDKGQQGRLTVSNLTAYDAIITETGNVGIKYTTYAARYKSSCSEQSYLDLGNAEGMEQRVLNIKPHMEKIGGNAGCDRNGWDVVSRGYSHQQFSPAIGVR
ncbi:MAG: hypothetical protein DI586_11230 [Micavibrio aeruginosavorus]|uniref:Lipoprotein n=1 Tax=Micavibrio aeruginosavorus TaxID=349221 RepID=A0A2W5FAZ9_9BACT|nr:MAG: hypothetical protein DI586_11230 [Micavibrio aeruginosavorus]